MSALDAGRALDAEVAEKVMGLVACTSDSHRNGTAPWRCYANPTSPNRGAELQPYSTDIASAWLVVEKLTGFDTNREEPWWSVAVFNAQKGQVGCRVYACPPGHSIFDVGDVHTFGEINPTVIAESVGSTAPEAICLAALRVSLSSGTQPDEVKT